MNGRVFIELLMTAVLVANGSMLINALPDHPEEEHEQTLADANNRLVFADGAGVDVYGKAVRPLNDPQVTRVVGFLLRSASLDEDLQLWEDVAKLLGGDLGVRLVGYCDGAACMNRVRQRKAGLFPVISFGEMIDAQAILNADVEGSFWRADRLGGSRRFRWRDEAVTAPKIVLLVQS